MSHIVVDNSADAAVQTEAAVRTIVDTALADNQTNTWSTYKNLVTRSAYTLDTQTATTRMLQAGGGAVAGTNATGAMVHCFYINPTELAIAGRTTKLNIQAVLGTNNTSVGTTTITTSLYPVTMANGADTVQITLGTIVPSSSIQFVNPSTNVITASTTGDIDIPAAGLYCLTSYQTVQIATDSAFGIVSTVRYRHVAS